MNQVDYSTLWKSYRDAASEAAQRGDLKTAEKILRDALTEGEEHNQLDPHLIEQLHTLAAMYCVNQQYDDAECIYRHVLEVREKTPSTEHRDVIDSLEKLAIVLRETSKKAEAITIGFKVLTFKAKLLSA